MAFNFLDINIEIIYLIDIIKENNFVKNFERTQVST